MAAAPGAAAPGIADVFEMLARDLRGGSVRLRPVLTMMGDRSMGWVLLLLTIPQLMPMPLVLSNLLALPVVLIAAQMAFGRRRPWLPHWLLERPVSRARLAKGCRRLVPLLRRVERVIGPGPGPRPVMARLEARRRLLGTCCLAIALFLLAPLPFMTWLPAWALAAIAVGLVERNALLVLAGLVLGALSAAAFLVTLASLLHLGERAQSLLPSLT